MKRKNKPKSKSKKGINMYYIIDTFNFGEEPLPLIKGDQEEKDGTFPDISYGETLFFETRDEAKQYAQNNCQQGYWKIIKE
jgi:hypothetical protein